MHDHARGQLAQRDGDARRRVPAVPRADDDEEDGAVQHKADEPRDGDLHRDLGQPAQQNLLGDQRRRHRAREREAAHRAELRQHRGQDGMAAQLYATAKALDEAIQAFVANPSEETQNAAKEAWIAARIPYQLTEVYRFGNPTVDDWEGKVNAWPLDEGLIDYVKSDDYQHALGNDGANANIKATLKEASRVLKPGGRIFVSDIVLLRPLPGFIRRSMALYAACIAGRCRRRPIWTPSNKPASPGST